ncbi:MAG: ABC transporter permease [Planctomycetes bacterium]|nr:ABC transporter permease [Planctomycetota bacterium]
MSKQDEKTRARKLKRESFWRITVRRFLRSKLGMVGLAIAIAMLLVGFFAPIIANDRPIVCRFQGEIFAPGVVELFDRVPIVGWLVSQSYPFDQATFDFHRDYPRQKEDGDWALMPPIPYHPLATTSEVLEKPSAKHWLGTDQVGRDLASRMIYGARISMLVGFVSMSVATVIGLILGSLAGYFGGWVDVIISRFIEVVICFPVFFLILLLIAVLDEPSIWLVMAVIGAVSWTNIARYIRGEFIRLRDSEFAMAAKALGAGHGRIIFRHLLPNSLAPVFVTVTFGIASAIIAEAALSWLGVGVRPPAPSWGNILQQAYGNMQTTPHMLFPPCVAIFFAVLSYNLIGDTLRDAVDPRVSKS